MQPSVTLERDRPHPRVSPPRLGELPVDLFDPVLAAGDLGAKDALHLAAVLDGAKPGVLFVFHGDGASEPVVDALDDAHLPHRLAARRHPGGEVDTELLAVAGTTDAYTTIPPHEQLPVVGTGGAVGWRFLGIPENDVCWYEEDEHEDGPEWPLLDAYGIDEPEDARLLRLLHYVARPTGDGIGRAIETARAFRDACQRVAVGLDDDRVAALPEQTIERERAEGLSRYLD